MKAKIYMMALAAVLSLSACEEDYSEASKVHVYSETENPPLKGSDALNGNASSTLKEGEPGVVLNLNDYDAEVKKAMDMTMDEVFAGLDNGSVRFLIVNPNRRIWDKTPANAGDNTWAISAQASVCDPADAAYLVRFDKAARTVTYELGPKAASGTMASIVVGFARTDDSAYPVNWRLRNVITVADLSLVDIEATVPAGDYAAYYVEFGEYARNIEFAFGLTDLTQFANWLDPESGMLEMYLLNTESGARYGSPDNYTANGMGYWANGNYETCVWGADGFRFFVEADMWDWDTESARTDGGAMGIGRAPGLESGAEIDGSFVLVSKKDPSKALTFRVHLVCE